MEDIYMATDLTHRSPEHQRFFPKPTSPIHHTMQAPTDKPTQVLPTHESRNAHDAATGTKVPATSKLQTSSPGSDRTQEELRYWEEVALLTEGWDRAIRSGDRSLIREWKDLITAQETVFNDRAKERPESAMPVRTMIFTHAPG